jgi:hypothetical protein
MLSSRKYFLAMCCFGCNNVIQNTLKFFSHAFLWTINNRRCIPSVLKKYNSFPYHLQHRVEFLYSCVDLVCVITLFNFISNLVHITRRQSYMKNYGLWCNTSWAVDSNYTICMLRRHHIISQTHSE